MTDDLTALSPDNDALRALVGRLFDTGHVIAGRWCLVCRSDLSDAGASSPVSAAAGDERVGSSWPQGGHQPDCPAAALLEWYAGPDIYTRRRDDGAA